MHLTFKIKGIFQYYHNTTVKTTQEKFEYEFKIYINNTFVQYFWAFLQFLLPYEKKITFFTHIFNLLLISGHKYVMITALYYFNA